MIHAGRLIDGVSKTPRTEISILIHDDRITGVQARLCRSLAGARVIDLSDATVLPGLIDCHVHITTQFDGGDTVREAVTRTDYDDAYASTRYVRATLEAGFTSVRDVGGDTRPGRGSEAGHRPPELHVPGPPHVGGRRAAGTDRRSRRPGRRAGPRNCRTPRWDQVTIDSPEAARHAVRDFRRRGVDLIKIMPSGGVLSIGDDPMLQLMADDEIKAVVDTAHALHMKVAAHVQRKPRRSTTTIALGVDSIEQRPRSPTR